MHPHHGDALRVQGLVSRLVLVCPISVNVSVQLNTKLRLRTVEIEHVTLDRMLSAK